MHGDISAPSPARAVHSSAAWLGAAGSGWQYPTHSANRPALRREHPDARAQPVRRPAQAGEFPACRCRLERYRQLDGLRQENWQRRRDGYRRGERSWSAHDRSPSRIIEATNIFGASIPTVDSPTRDGCCRANASSVIAITFCSQRSRQFEGLLLRRTLARDRARRRQPRPARSPAPTETKPRAAGPPLAGRARPGRQPVLLRLIISAADYRTFQRPKKSNPLPT